MSTATEPTTARFKHRDREYVIDLTAVNATDARAYRRGTGGEGRLMDLLGDMEAGDIDLDMVPALVWLARRQAGEDAAISDVEAEFDLLEWQHFDFKTLDDDPLG